ncbi:MAG: ABC transporter ATP-binding protein [Alphaproteobacteria bacterium]
MTKRFGPLTAVDRVSFKVRKGEVLGFLGPNGAGKSTTMKMITGFLSPTEGTAVVNGADVAEDPIAVKSHIGYLPEGAPLYGDMTARALLNFVAEIRGMSKPERKRRIEEVIEQVHLEEVIFRPIETLSKGFKRRVGLAQAILHDPELLILDEPTDGLDPNQKHEVRTLLQKMAADKAIVISTHILEEVDAVCSRALIIAHGKLLADGTPEELRAQSTAPNSLSVRVSVAQAEQIRGKLRAMMGVGFVEIVGKVDGVAHLTVAPEGDDDVTARVAELLEAEDAGAEPVLPIPGSLDDVFREITQGQGR